MPTRSPVIRAATAFAAVLALCASAAPASGSWSSRTFLSGTGMRSEWVDVALDPDGNALVAWVRSNGTNRRIQVRSLSAAGVKGVTQTVSAAGADAEYPQVALNASGDAIIAWQRFDGAHKRVQIVARSANGVLSAVQTVSEAGQEALYPEVGIDDGGRAVITWQRFDGAHWRVQAVARAADGSPGGVQTLSGQLQDSQEPQIALDGAGNAVIAWWGGSNEWQIRTRTLSADGKLSATQTVSSPGGTHLKVRLAVTELGAAVFAWETQLSDTETQVQARARSAAGQLGPVQQISPIGLYELEPAVAVDSSGNAVFTWQEGSVGLGTAVINGRRLSAAGALGAITPISQPGVVATDTRVESDAAGNAVAMWEFESSGILGAVAVRYWPAAGAPASAQVLSDTAYYSIGPELDMTPGGLTTAVWETYTDSAGSEVRIQASRGP